jgi:hypothetical protein
MSTRVLYLEDQALHAANSADFKELCRLELRPDLRTYLVIAKGDLLNVATETPPAGFADHGYSFPAIRRWRVLPSPA